MSYEGHYDGLCEKGHQCGFPCMYGDESEMFRRFRCNSLVDGKVCGAKLGYLNAVDDTNCESYGRREYIELTPEVTKTCDMGHTHVITAATYRFSDISTYRDNETGKLLEISKSPLKPINW